LLQAFEDLRAADIPVLIVTGRSAGWVSGLVTYLPVVGAIAENGGLFYPADSDQPVALTPIPDLVAHRQQLEVAYQRLKSEFPHIQESTDNRFRLTDWTFDNRDLTLTQLERLDSLCSSMGWGFTYSSVQCHIKPASQDKATGLMQVLHDYFPQYAPQQVVTVGDSPNDASLFNPQLFPLSVGVANVLDYASELIYQPAYVTTAVEGEGFCELAQYLIESVT
jgi:hydroxymethylpyrimidine pyrophosphatase-like HAD family hydrolase